MCPTKSEGYFIEGELIEKILSVLTLTAAATALCCPSVFAAEELCTAPNSARGFRWYLPYRLWASLLCIAICPLVIPEKWEKWRWLFVLFWSLLFLIPFALTYNVPTMVDQLLESLMGDYLTFIVLLFGLFCVAGNICLEGDLAGTPKTNVLLLLIGTALASWIGTTGASMVMIRPILRANRWRSKCVQTVVFFIFLVSNIGGCLTPIGDPPAADGLYARRALHMELQHLLPIMALNGAAAGHLFRDGSASVPKRPGGRSQAPERWCKTALERRTTLFSCW